MHDMYGVFIENGCQIVPNISISSDIPTIDSSYE